MSGGPPAHRHEWVVEKDSNFQHCKICGIIEHIETPKQTQKKIKEEIAEFWSQWKILPEKNKWERKKKEQIRQLLNELEEAWK